MEVDLVDFYKPDTTGSILQARYYRPDTTGSSVVGLVLEHTLPQ